MNNLKILNSFHNIVNRFSILLGRPTNLEVELQDHHAKMIEAGYYRKFRRTLDSFYLSTRLELNQSEDAIVIAGLSANEIKLASVQKSLVRTIQSLKFKKSIAFSQFTNIPLWFPLSRKSQKQLKNLDLHMNSTMCSLLNQVFNLSFVVKSFQKACRNHCWAIKAALNGEKHKIIATNPIDSIYLGGLSATNFPSKDYASFNFLEWVQDKLGREKLYLHDCIDLNLSETQDPYHRIEFNPIVAPTGTILSEFRVVFKVTALILKTVFISKVKVFDILSQVDEIAISIRVSIKSGKNEIEFALFPNTVSVVRPLWSTSLEKCGTKVILVHYSASAEPLEIGANRVIDGVWHLSSWRNTWIVDEYQKKQMRSISQFSANHFEVVGVPYWSGRVLDSSFFLGGPWISVFDTTIRTNLVFSASSIDDLGWNDSNLEEEFIRIILDTAVLLKFKVLHKKKRRVSESNLLKFDETVKLLKSEYGEVYSVVDEDIAPECLIEKSSFVISKPISTIAFAAVERGVPTIILDPTGNILRNDPGLRDLPLAQNRADLTAFLLRG